MQSIINFMNPIWNYTPAFQSNMNMRYTAHVCRSPVITNSNTDKQTCWDERVGSEESDNELGVACSVPPSA